MRKAEKVVHHYREVMLPPWRYISEPPYRVAVVDTNTDRLLGLHEFVALDDALVFFVRFHVGPMIDRSVALVDVNEQIVIGYRATEKFQWFGTEGGFAALALHYDQMTVAVWEIDARGTESPFEVPVEDNVR